MSTRGSRAPGGVSAPQGFPDSPSMSRTYDKATKAQQVSLARLFLEIPRGVFLRGRVGEGGTSSENCSVVFDSL